jgi:hypothetical protein
MMLHFDCNVETLKNAMISVFRPHWRREIFFFHYALHKSGSLLYILGAAYVVVVVFFFIKRKGKYRNCEK